MTGYLFLRKCLDNFQNENLSYKGSNFEAFLGPYGTKKCSVLRGLMRFLLSLMLFTSVYFSSA